MGASVRRVSLVAVTLAAVSCSNSAPLTALRPSPLPPPAAVQPAPTPEIPPTTGPSAVYTFSGPLTYPVRTFTETSSFVLYETGTYQLRYQSPPGTISGAFHRENDLVIFNGGWAIGTLIGDLLEIRFSDMAQQSDFENAVYRRSGR
jgi:hypothetical protein